MKKYSYLIFLIIAIFIINGCGDSGGGVISPTATPAATATLNPTQAAATSDAEKVSDGTNDTCDTVNSVGLTVLDYSGISTSGLNLESSETITIPPTPSAPPTIPSGNPTYTKTTPLGASIVFQWYLYITNISNPTAWIEWKETDNYGTPPTTLDYAYGQIFAPTPQPIPSIVTREFNISRWMSDNKTLLVYTKGSTTYNTMDPNNVTVNGTQVAFFPKAVAGYSQLAYTFSCMKKTDGTMEGSLTFEKGTGTFARTATNYSAIGTGNVYSSTTGSVSITSPISKQITFTNTVYGDNSMKLASSATNVTTTMNYNADGSGTGTVVASQTTIDLVWDKTGYGTATIKIGGQSYTVQVYIPYPYTPVLPKPY